MTAVPTGTGRATSRCSGARRPGAFVQSRRGGGYSPRRDGMGGESCRCWRRWASSPAWRPSTGPCSSRPSTTATLVAEALERPVAEVEDGARHRSSRRASPLRTDEQEYVAAPPAVALGALITERRDGLRLAEQALATLAEEHRAAVAGRSISDLIEVVTGVDAVRHRYQQVQQAATDRAADVRHRAVRRGPAGGERGRAGRRGPRRPDPRGARARRARRAGRQRGAGRLAAPRAGAAGRRAAAHQAGARRRRPGPGAAGGRPGGRSGRRDCCSAAASSTRSTRCSRPSGAGPTRSSSRAWTVPRCRPRAPGRSVRPRWTGRS